VFDFSSATTPGWSTGGDNPAHSPYAFTRATSGVSAGITGSSAGAGGFGVYYYTDASVDSFDRVGDVFTLAYDGSACASSSLDTISFHYHFYGKSMGTLRLVTDPGSSEVWRRSGDNGNHDNTWHEATVNVNAASFRFEYVRGYFGSNAAIAKVMVSCSPLDDGSVLELTGALPKIIFGDPSAPACELRLVHDPVRIVSTCPLSATGSRRQLRGGDEAPAGSVSRDEFDALKMEVEVLRAAVDKLVTQRRKQELAWRALGTSEH